MVKSLKENEVSSYMNVKGVTLWQYRIKFYDALGKRKEKRKIGFKTEKAAIRSLLEVKAALINGNVKQVEHDQLTIGEWLDIWFESNKHTWKPTTLSQREMAIRLHFKPILANYKLQQLDKSTYIRVFIQPLLKRYKHSTVQLFHRLFKVAINAAVDEEILQRNRFKKISFANNDLDQQDSVKTNFYTPEELSTLLKVAKETEPLTSYLLLKVIAYSGIRRGEAMGLQWKHINFEKNSLKIEQTRDNKGLRTPKTKNSYRTILLDPSVLNELKSYRTWCKETMLFYGHRWSESSFVFISSQTGEAYTDNGLLYAMRRVQVKAGLRKITVHGLRHSHATMLLLKNVNVKTISERLGNTPQMIHDIYGHVLQEMEVDSMRIFSDTMDQASEISRIK